MTAARGGARGARVHWADAAASILMAGASNMSYFWQCTAGSGAYLSVLMSRCCSASRLGGQAVPVPRSCRENQVVCSDLCFYTLDPGDSECGGSCGRLLHHVVALIAAVISVMSVSPRVMNEDSSKSATEQVIRGRIVMIHACLRVTVPRHVLTSNHSSPFIS